MKLNIPTLQTEIIAQDEKGVTVRFTPESKIIHDKVVAFIDALDACRESDIFISSE